METMKAIAVRQSVRKFKKDQIPDDVLETILKAGSAAPVGLGAFDSLHFTVIQNQEILNRISENAAEALGQPGASIIYNAPTLIVISSKKHEIEGLAQANTGCTAENMLIAAADAGLGSIYLLYPIFAFNDESKLAEEIGIPEGFSFIGSVALGYSEDALTERELQHKISFNRI